MFKFEIKKTAASARAAFETSDGGGGGGEKLFDEHIIEFDENEIVSTIPKKKNEPLVIVPTKRKPIAKPKKEEEEKFVVVETEEKKPQKYGLQVFAKTSKETSMKEDAETEERNGPLLQFHNGSLDAAERYKEDLATRAEEATLEDYESIPIEQFGAAMLRGMGWKDGEAVGKNQEGLLKPVLLKPRPHLLGLGATPAPLPTPPDMKLKKNGNHKSTPPPPPPSSRQLPTRREEPPRRRGISKGSRVIVKKKNKHFNRKARVRKVKDATSDGIPITIEFSDNEEMRCYADEVDLID